MKSCLLPAIILSCLWFALPSQSQTIGDAKLLPDGDGVMLTGKVVTYTGTNMLYIQEADRSSGIRVVSPGHTIATGSTVSVSGLLSTSETYEREILAEYIGHQDAEDQVAPLILANRSLWGGNWNYNPETGAGQMGMTGGTHLNTTGLLVQTTGRVAYVSPQAGVIFITDGSALPWTGSMATGSVQVRFPGAITASIQAGMVVTVTGVVSMDQVGESTIPVLLARDVDDLQRDFPNLDAVFVSAGSFLMGNSGVGYDLLEGLPREFPQHWVYVPEFWLSQYEVTRGDFREFIEAGGYQNPDLWTPEGWSWKTALNREAPDFWDAEQTWAQGDLLNPVQSFVQTDTHPVVGVSWYEADAFARWCGGRLPTEAEWEKAARWSGLPRVFPWGSMHIVSRANGWYDYVTRGWRTSPVGAYALGQSPYGVYDMAGNVWEWTSDWYQSHPASDFPFDFTGQMRTAKGGSWYGNYGLRPAARFGMDPGATRFDVGFRVAW